MGLSDYKINSFSKPVSALDDTPQMSAAELKEWFDSNSANELKQSVNGIIEELKDVDVSKQHMHDNKEILDNIGSDTYATKEELRGYAVKSEKDLIDSSSIRLYGVKKNQDVFEAPRSNTSSSEANEDADKNATGYDRFLNEDVYIYQNTIMRRDDNGRCSVLAPAYPKHIANKEYVDNAVGNIETVLDNIIAIQNGLIGGDA